MSMEIYDKIASIMCWNVATNTTAEDYYTHEFGNTSLPNEKIIDVVYNGGLDMWAKNQNDVESIEELADKLYNIVKLTVTDSFFYDKNTKTLIPRLKLFFDGCVKIEKSLKGYKECTKIATEIYLQFLMNKQLNERCGKLFSLCPDKEKYFQAVKRIKEVWKFSEQDIEMFRYFACQSKSNNWKPSQNKCIYIWGKEKQTGKTTIARAIVAALNGDTLENAGQYESSFAVEMQFGAHNIPKACKSNCVLLDEAMPKDSSKVYGQLKAMLTRNYATINPKWLQEFDMPAKRNYICTSNEDIADFIQDESERRFYAINIEIRPERISFDEIFNIWNDFVLNAEPEQNIQEWYDSFELCSGYKATTINDLVAELLNYDRLVQNMPSTSMWTYKMFGSFLFSTERMTTNENMLVKEAVNRLFKEARGEGSNSSKFKKNICLLVVNKLNTINRTPEEVEEEEIDKSDNLPF